ncbi:MAG TPA: BolA family protein [Woeseiaceae bacterium]
MTTDRVTLIEQALKAAFEPVDLLVKDQSHLHAGHAGARDGRGHFDVRIVSNAFEGVSPLARHRMVYEALGPLMQTDVHALQIQARTPAEA